MAGKPLPIGQMINVAQHDKPPRIHTRTRPQYTAPRLGVAATDADADTTAVKVVVRARPLLASETAEKCEECIEVAGGDCQIVFHGSQERRFMYDHVFGPDCRQEDVYNECVQPLVESWLEGFNATVLAYGQTGSGKTHTMGTSNTSPYEDQLGILPRLIGDVFQELESRRDQLADYLVKCAYVEIYNEDVRDLLHPNASPHSIAIREDVSGGIVLAGVKEVAVTSFSEMARQLERGSLRRRVGSTLMNTESSRSHAIFTITCQQRKYLDAENCDVVTAKFHLVDLAGSERAKRTGAVGVRFKESITINCGLLALGNVISTVTLSAQVTLQVCLGIKQLEEIWTCALGDGKKRGCHVPYRDSKLTRLLQDSLGGNSRTLMIACISTAQSSVEETLNTLKYANRARNICNKPVINRDPQTAQLHALRSELLALQQELLQAHGAALSKAAQPSVPAPAAALRAFLSKEGMPDEAAAELAAVQKQSLWAMQECHRLRTDLQVAQSKAKKLQQESLELKMERDSYQKALLQTNARLMELLAKIPSWAHPTAQSTPKELLPALQICVLSLLQHVSAPTQGSSPRAPSESRVGQIDTEEGAGGHAKVGKVGVSSSSEKPVEQRGTTGSSSHNRGTKSVAQLRSRPGPGGGRDSLGAGQRRTVRGLGWEAKRGNSPQRQLASPTRRMTPSSPQQAWMNGPSGETLQQVATVGELETKLLRAEQAVRSHEAELAKARQDLARGEIICVEKVKENQALMTELSGLTTSLNQFVQDREASMAAIKRLANENTAKDAKLAALQARLEQQTKVNQELSTRVHQQMVFRAGEGMTPEERKGLKGGERDKGQSRERAWHIAQEMKRLPRGQRNGADAKVKQAWRFFQKLAAGGNSTVSSGRSENKVRGCITDLSHVELAPRDSASCLSLKQGLTEDGSLEQSGQQVEANGPAERPPRSSYSSSTEGRSNTCSPCPSSAPNAASERNADSTFAGEGMPGSNDAVTGGEHKVSVVENGGRQRGQGRWPNAHPARDSRSSLLKKEDSWHDHLPEQDGPASFWREGPLAVKVENPAQGVGESKKEPVLQTEPTCKDAESMGVSQEVLIAGSSSSVSDSQMDSHDLALEEMPPSWGRAPPLRDETVGEAMLLPALAHWMRDGDGYGAYGGGMESETDEDGTVGQYWRARAEVASNSDCERSEATQEREKPNNILPGEVKEEVERCRLKGVVEEAAVERGSKMRVAMEDGGSLGERGSKVADQEKGARSPAMQASQLLGSRSATWEKQNEAHPGSKFDSLRLSAENGLQGSPDGPDSLVACSEPREVQDTEQGVERMVNGWTWNQLLKKVQQGEEELGMLKAALATLKPSNLTSRKHTILNPLQVPPGSESQSGGRSNAALSQIKRNAGLRLNSTGQARPPHANSIREPTEATSGPFFKPSQTIGAGRQPRANSREAVDRIRTSGGTLEGLSDPTCASSGNTNETETNVSQVLISGHPSITPRPKLNHRSQESSPLSGGRSGLEASQMKGVVGSKRQKVVLGPPLEAAEREGGGQAAMRSSSPLKRVGKWSQGGKGKMSVSENEYNDKLRRPMEQMKVLMKQTQHESGQAQGSPAHKNRQTDIELEAMQAQGSLPPKRNKENSRWEYEETDVGNWYMAALQQNMEAHMRRVQDLEAENQRQRDALQCKTEEVAIAHKKLTALGVDPMSGGTTVSSRERSMAYDNTRRLTKRVSPGAQQMRRHSFDTSK